MSNLLTPTQAANEWGLQRPKIYEKMRNGELSYVSEKKSDGKQDEKGSKKGRRLIDPSEMNRVFGPPKNGTLAGESQTTDNEFPNELPTKATLVDVYKQLLSFLRSQLTEKDLQISKKDAQLEKQADLLKAKDEQLRSLIDQLDEMSQRLLPAPVVNNDVTLAPDVDDYFEGYDDEPEPETVKKRWWQFGKSKAESVY